MKAILTVLATAASLCLAHAAHALPESNTIEFSNCMLALPGTTHTAEAQCGYIDVPENPDDPDGRQISLHVAVAKATSTDVAPDPVFFFAGGPGQAASEAWVIIRPTLRDIRKHRDIVMIDQRGTGQSNKLNCPLDDDFDLNAEIDLELIARETRRCADNLDADPRFYTTTHGMRDYDRVRRAMGYDQINLVGVSYGTRAAQVYLRMFPDTVRTVTLDSVVPMQLALGQEHAPMLDQAVSAVFEDCRGSESCQGLFPTTRNELQQLFASLREEPRWVTLPNPTTGEDLELRVTAETLAVAIRFLSYSSESQAVLPLLVHEAVQTGDLSRLAAQAILVMSGLNEMIARGMELSVMCAEDYPYMNLGADYSDTLIGNIFLESIQATCEAWPHGTAPDGFHDPVVSDVPVLLVAGERDPVTPPHYAAQAAETFSNSVNLVARGQSHSVLRNVCLQDVATQFIEQGSIENLDLDCIERIEPSPFFTSLLGPDP
ncbi:MAG: alpha/beta fold hydrolase [Xanthomonadales bacterium]|nr:alpha/beta fold hydrolase [Xanthomonadales bacterium]